MRKMIIAIVLAGLVAFPMNAFSMELEDDLLVGNSIEIESETEENNDIQKTDLDVLDAEAELEDLTIDEDLFEVMTEYDIPEDYISEDTISEDGLSDIIIDEENGSEGFAMSSEDESVEEESEADPDYLDDEAIVEEYVPEEVKTEEADDNTTSEEVLNRQDGGITASGVCGSNVNWKLENGVLTIYGSGRMNDYSVFQLDSYPYPPWKSYYHDISKIIINSGVTSIGMDGFRFCDNVTNITLPNSVTSIGVNAFHSCTSLTDITIPNSVTSIGTRAFYYCTNLTNITIPDNVTSIGDVAFGQCSSLKSIRLSNGLTNIGSETFLDCNSLTAITIPSNVRSIGKSAFSGCSSLSGITIQSNLTSIGEEAFNHCDSLTGITLPDSVMSIGKRAFGYCGSLTSITLPNSVTSIGEYVFQNCINLVDCTIPDSVSSIGECAFDSCTSLTGITIPNSVTSIGRYAFSGCSSLSDISLPNSVVSIGEYAFIGCTALADDAGFIVVRGILYDYCGSGMAIAIPSSVTDIGPSAFRECADLTSITIPNSVTCIGRIAFYNCDSLTSITIPNSVTYIGEMAFENCSSLETVTVQSQEITFGSRVFNSCPKLTKIYGYSGSSTETAAADAGIAFVPCAGKCGEDVYWTYQEGVLTISGNGEMYDYSLMYVNGFATSTTAPWKDLSEDINIVVIEQGVASIGRSTFWSPSSKKDLTIFENFVSRFSSLTSIMISDSVTSIGENALSGCEALTSIILPNNVTSIGNTAFSGCSSLTNISIPDCVDSIGDYAFQDCSSLETVTVLSRNNTCGSMAFDACPNLTRVYGYSGTGAETAAANAGIQFVAYDVVSNYNFTASIPSDGYTYNAAAKKPAVSLEFDGMVLENGTDYSVVYANNVNAGTATVTATGKGPYTTVDDGMKFSESFTIKKAPITGAKVTLSTTSYTYNGQPKKPSATVVVGDRTLKNGTDYTIAYANNVNYGTATATITGTGNYSSEKVTKSFTIKKASLNGAKVTLSTTTYTYNGLEKKPSAKVVVGGRTLKGGTDYTVAYSGNKNAGTGTVTIKGKGNYLETPAVSAKFTIKKASPALTVTKSYSKIYGNAPFKLNASTKSGKLTYVSSNKTVATVDTTGKVTLKAPGTTTITVTSPATTNYNKATATVKVTVSLKQVALSSVTSPSKTKLSIKWQKNTTGQGYEVYVSTSKTFTSGTRMKKITNISTVSIAPDGLTSGKVWYVRMRVYRKIGTKMYYGPWSVVKSVKVK